VIATLVVFSVSPCDFPSFIESMMVVKSPMNAAVCSALKPQVFE